MAQWKYYYEIWCKIETSSHSPNIGSAKYFVITVNWKYEVTLKKIILQLYWYQSVRNASKHNKCWYALTQGKPDCIKKKFFFLYLKYEKTRRLYRQDR